ncbi:MAG TPA: glycosyl transferase family 1, partial [Veillonellaceae bacterium]|nr:glycosyl transferase family 1 [Veillonellaceae bacterium]
MKIIMAYLENFSGLSGGLEKILCEFSNEMEQRGHEVSIVTYDERTGKPFYLLKEDIHIFN